MSTRKDNYVEFKEIFFSDSSVLLETHIDVDFNLNSAVATAFFIVAARKIIGKLFEHMRSFEVTDDEKKTITDILEKNLIDMREELNAKNE